jgi:hypothetical protein
LQKNKGLAGETLLRNPSGSDVASNQSAAFAASKKAPFQGRAQHHPIATVWSILDEDNHGTMKEGLHIA